MKVRTEPARDLEPQAKALKRPRQVSLRSRKPAREQRQEPDAADRLEPALLKKRKRALPAPQPKPGSEVTRGAELVELLRDRLAARRASKDGAPEGDSLLHEAYFSLRVAAELGRRRPEVGPVICALEKRIAATLPSDLRLLVREAAGEHEKPAKPWRNHGALGRTRFDPDHWKKQYMERYGMLNGYGGDLLAIASDADDPSLRALFERASSLGFDLIHHSGDDRYIKEQVDLLNLLRVLARMREIGLPIRMSRTRLDQLLARLAPAHDPPTVAVLRRAARAFGWDEAGLLLPYQRRRGNRRPDGQALAGFPETPGLPPAIGSHPLGQLGTEAYDYGERLVAFRCGDPVLSNADDPTILGLSETQCSGYSGAYLDRVSSGVRDSKESVTSYLRVMTRLFELGAMSEFDPRNSDSKSKEHGHELGDIDGFIHDHLERHGLDPELMDVIAQLYASSGCRFFSADPRASRAFLEAERRLANRSALDRAPLAVGEETQGASLGALVDESASPVERRDAVAAVLSQGEQLFPKLLVAVREAIASNRLRPVRVDDLVPALRAQLADELFADWDHIGAIAVISGLMTRLLASDIEALLLRRGYDRESSDRWARAAVALRNIHASELDFVSVDLLRRPPDFSTLLLRMMLANDAREVGLRGESLSRAASADPIAFARVILERAQRGDHGEGAEAIELLAWAASAGFLEHDDVVEAAEEIGFDLSIDKSILAPILMGSLNDTISSSEGSTERRLDPLLDAFDRAALIVGAPVVAEWLLEKLHAADIAREPSLNDDLPRSDLTALAVARVEELVDRGESAPLEDARSWRWVEAAVLRALREKRPITDATFVGLAEAFRLKLISSVPLELARETFPSARRAELADRMQSSEARAIALDQPRASRGNVRRSAVYRSVEEPTTGPVVDRGPAPGRKAPEDRTDFVSVRVRRGPRAPAERPLRI
jgi:hypothetical protein